ncbi:MAG: hypothetical protein ACREV0_04695 [Burkholderiales bacterium]
MQCVRCQAEDNVPARFCRACGYPYVFDELMSCPVCGGEVRAGSKICPGCHHQFAIAAVRDNKAVPRRHTRYALPVACVFALAGLAFFYGSAGNQSVPRESNPQPNLLAAAGQSKIALQSQATEKAPEHSQTSAAPEMEENKSEPVPVFKEIVEPEGAAAASAPKRMVAPRIVPAQKQQKAVASSSMQGGARAQPVAKAEAATPKIETRPANSAKAGAAGPKVREESSTVAQPTPAPDGHAAQNNGAHDAKLNGANTNVAAVERGKVGTAKRGAPVVERSRVADPGHVNLIVRENSRLRRCEGKWEGECRRFPDHKPNW